MLNKMLEVVLVIMLVILTIVAFMWLFVVLRCMIQIVICDYERWKRYKAEKERYRKMEDKFKNRKLTD